MPPTMCRLSVNQPAQMWVLGDAVVPAMLSLSPQHQGPTNAISTLVKGACTTATDVKSNFAWFWYLPRLAQQLLWPVGGVWAVLSHRALVTDVTDSTACHTILLFHPCMKFSFRGRQEDTTAAKSHCQVPPELSCLSVSLEANFLSKHKDLFFLIV